MNWYFRVFVTSGFCFMLTGAAFAARQASPPVVDGNISDINWAGQVPEDGEVSQ